MPQKACERWFCHVMAFAWNAQKSKNFIWFWKWKKWGISNTGAFPIFGTWSILKWKRNRKLTHNRCTPFKYDSRCALFSHFPLWQQTQHHRERRSVFEMPHFQFSESNNILRFLGIPSKCHHMTKSSFTCFLRHLILLLVFDNFHLCSKLTINYPDIVFEWILWNEKASILTGAWMVGAS